MLIIHAEKKNRIREHGDRRALRDGLSKQVIFEKGDE